jgi:hypothetical protein
MFDIQLEWEVASQYVVRAVTRFSKPDFAIFPAEDATTLRHHPLEVNPTLYAEFARLDGSESSLLGFAHKYGLLLTQPSRSALDPGMFENFETWRGHIENLRAIVGRCELSRANPAEAFRQFGRQDENIGFVEIFLSIKSSQSPFGVEVRAPSLIGAIQLQAIQSILEGRTSFQCINCSRPFPVGTGARRSHSKFCSTRCKDSYHNRLKAQARRMDHA